MPELPEVETIVRGLNKQVVDCFITDVKIYYKNLIISNCKQFEKEIKNRQIIKISRHGKYIFIHLSKDKIIVIHLRMTGQLFTKERNEKPDKHTHLELFLKGEKIKVVYRDIRKFGRFELISSNDYDQYLFNKNLASDALVMKPDDFYQKVIKKKKAIKAVLLDQQVIAGIGNIYADEILFREKISPFFLSSDLTRSQGYSLLKRIKKVLNNAILKKGTTFSDYVNSYGEKGQFQLVLKAYKQEGKPCSFCKAPIVRSKVAGRSTFFCPECQK